MRKRMQLFYPYSICPLMYSMKIDIRHYWLIKVTGSDVQDKAIFTRGPGMMSLHDFPFEIYLEEYYGRKGA